MSEMLTGPKKIVDGLTEVFRGLTQMCEGMAEQIELLEFTPDDATEEDKLIPPAKLPPVDTAPKALDVPHPRKKPVKRPVIRRTLRLWWRNRPMNLLKKLLRRKILPQRRLRKNCPTSRMTLQMTCPLIGYHPKGETRTACCDHLQGRDHGSHRGEDQAEAQQQRENRSVAEDLRRGSAF